MIKTTMNIKTTRIMMFMTMLAENAEQSNSGWRGHDDEDNDHHCHAHDHKNLQYFDHEDGDHYHNPHHHHVDDLLMQDRESEKHTLEPDGVPGDLKNCSGISRYIPVYPGISRYIPVHQELSIV